MRFRLVPKASTLDDLERPKRIGVARVGEGGVSWRA